VFSNGLSGSGFRYERLKIRIGRVLGYPTRLVQVRLERGSRDRERCHARITDLSDVSKLPG